MVDGLWVQPMGFFVGFIAAQGFNALRIPLAVDHINSKIKPDMCSKDPAMLQLAQAGGRYLDAVERLVILAAHAGLLVVLDMHRLEANVWPDPDGLWYRVGDNGLDAQRSSRLVTCSTLLCSRREKSCWDASAHTGTWWAPTCSTSLGAPSGARAAQAATGVRRRRPSEGTF